MTHLHLTPEDAPPTPKAAAPTPDELDEPDLSHEGPDRLDQDELDRAEDEGMIEPDSNASANHAGEDDAPDS